MNEVIKIVDSKSNCWLLVKNRIRKNHSNIDSSDRLVESDPQHHNDLILYEKIANFNNYDCEHASSL